MILDDFNVASQLNARLTSSITAVLSTYRLGVANQTWTVPTDANQMAVRDIVITGATQKVLTIKDFNVDAGPAYQDIDCVDVNIVTMYGFMAFIQSTTMGPTENSRILFTPSAFPTFFGGGVIHEDFSESSGVLVGSFFSFFFESGIDTTAGKFTIKEIEGVTSTVRVIAFGKNT